MFGLKWSNMSNFQPLEDRDSETQPQVVENSNKLNQQDRVRIIINTWSAEYFF